MGANISLPPIPDTADAKMKEYLTALTKALSTKQMDDYSSLQKVASDNNVSISQITSGTTSDLSVQLGAGIIETGSNTNGRWIKFSDGTMIQWGSGYDAALSYVINITNCYYHAFNSITLPTGFVDIYYSTSLSCIVRESGSKSAVASSRQIGSKTSFYGEIWKYSTGTSVETYWNWIAIGRWKA